ncbi:MAG TPA: O-antigen ligase family protein [Streptosporangiaceae bacterium]|nr:O-antigen ligase family protein [Streptosporangiaceae bacterium]
MTALAIGVEGERRVAARSDAVWLLQAFALCALIFPSSYVIKAIGGDGYVAALVSYCLFLAWVVAIMFGQHNPFDYRYPVRIALCAMWLVSLTSYVLIDRTVMTTTQLTGANRWLLQLVGVSGVILVSAECLRTEQDIRRVLRALTWGGAFCGIVSALQFWASLDITPYLLKVLPGFTINQADAAYSAIGFRDGVHRVAGTAIDPIELGVVAGMLLPLAVYLALHDLERSPLRRWAPVICIAFAVPASVSRSAILAAGLALGIMVVQMPPARRVTGIAATLVAIAGIFMTAHGLLGTLKSYFLAGTADNSIAHRVSEYPYVEKLVREAPWFGQGGGTYIVQEIHILDNEYLTTTIELGLLGLAALIFYLLWPAVAALVAATRTTDPSLRDLCVALGGAELAAVLCSGTFDSLSFPMFVSVQALVAGLIGAVWLLVDRSPSAGPALAEPAGGN